MKEGSKVEQAIDELIAGVDEFFPAALNPKASLFNTIEGSDLLDEVLRPNRERRDAELFAAANASSGFSAFEYTLYHWLPAPELAAAAIGYCAGLRAAGASVEQTRAMMHGFLRRLPEADRPTRQGEAPELKNHLDA